MEKLYTPEQRNRFVQNCGQIEMFEKIFRRNTAPGDDDEDVIAYGAKWYRCKITDSGIPYPSRQEAKSFREIDDGGDVKSVWNFLDIGLEWIRHDLRKAMFYEWGHGNPESDDSWLEINSSGETNYPIQEFPKQWAENLHRVLTEWVEKGRGQLRFTFCSFGNTVCRARFNQIPDPSKDPICPFARVFSSRSQKWSCCETAKCEGIMLDQVEEVFADVMSKDMVLSDHPRYIEAMTWLACMIAFLERRL